MFIERWENLSKGFKMNLVLFFFIFSMFFGIFWCLFKWLDIKMSLESVIKNELENVF